MACRPRAWCAGGDGAAVLPCVAGAQGLPRMELQDRAGRRARVPLPRLCAPAALRGHTPAASWLLHAKQSSHHAVAGAMASGCGADHRAEFDVSSSGSGDSADRRSGGVAAHPGLRSGCSVRPGTAAGRGTCAQTGRDAGAADDAPFRLHFHGLREDDAAASGEGRSD